MSAKLRSMFFAAVLLSAAGTGCSANADTYFSDNNSISYASVSETSGTGRADPSNEEEDTAYDENMYVVKEYMDALTHHNYDILMQYGGAQSYSVYSFLDGVSFSDWEMTGSVDYEGGDAENNRICTYFIKMNISESDSELFPVGESMWELDVSDSDSTYFSSFRPEGVSTDHILSEKFSALKFSESVKMAYAFSSAFGWLNINNKLIDTDCMDKLVKKERFINNLTIFCRYFGADENMLVDGTDYSAEWLSEKAERLLGLDSLDLSGIPNYNEEVNTVTNNESEYCFGYTAFSDEQYDKDSGLHTVVLDWYADTIFLAKAMTIKYTLTDNDDGTLKLISAEKIYDSGEKPLYFVKRIDIKKVDR